MIEIEGKYYVIDMDKMMAWVVETPASEKNINTITTMSYPITNEDDEEEIVEKEVSENKSTLNETMNNVRYDFIRILLNTIFTTFTNNMNQIITLTPEDLSFGQKLAFNTLVNKNIIKEIILDK
jgi:hypothetical protein